MPRNSLYYVQEKDLWKDVLELYRTDSFPETLAKNMEKMTYRIVKSRRFDSCSDLLREEMVSSAYTRVCLKLYEKKFDPKHGSRVYSWATRVILNECLNVIAKEQRKNQRFNEYAEDYAAQHQIEIVKEPDNY
jgi:DNA-directed RNA polymerase specialized sigma24 family protein